MGYETIAGSLENIINSVDGVAVVYDHEAKELGKYPAVTIIAMGHQNEYNDLQANKHSYNFAIRVYYRTDDAATAESTVRGIVDAIIEAVETDTTLSGACDFARPTSSTWAFGEREVPVRFAQVNVTARLRVPTR